MTHFADKFTHAAQIKRTCAIVGIDPVYEKLPKPLTQRNNPNAPLDIEAATDTIFEFCVKVLRIVAPLVPAVKLNSAFFEKYHFEGVETYYSLIQEASQLGLLVIGDVKRGDIGTTAAAYAQGHLANHPSLNTNEYQTPDAITSNAFAGLDAVTPFADLAHKEKKGIFVWIRPSNPSAAILSDFTDTNGKKFHELLAEQIATIADEPHRIGNSGYSDIGMIVGGTTAKYTKSMRDKYPHTLFLVPGYGAQGASAKDCMNFCKPDGSGALIAASRSIIYAYQNPKYHQQFPDNWEKCIEQATLDMKANLAQHMPT